MKSNFKASDEEWLLLRHNVFIKKALSGKGQGTCELVNNHLDSLYHKEQKKSSLGLQATQQA